MPGQKTNIKEKKNKGLDTVKLFNQPIAEEGVLSYIENGKEVKKLKKWKDLKANIGRTVSIIDEHPDEKNGKGGLVNKEKKYGTAKIIKCPNANRLLCSDPVLEDNSPNKKGYSIGFAYEPVNNPGKFGDQSYDQIQSNLWIDHIALTNHPRSGHAIQVAGDTIDIPGCNIAINKLNLDYDYIRFSSDKISKKTQVNKMPKRFDEIKAKLKSDNPEMDEEELNKRANQMKKNEEDQEEEELKKKEGDNLLIRMEKDALIAEISRLKAGKDAEKTYKSKIEKLEKEKDSLKFASDKYKTELEKVLTDQVQSNIKRLKSEFSFDAKEFDKKSPDFIEGALFASDRIGEGIKKKRSTAGDSSLNSINEDGTLNVNDWRFDFDSGKMKKLEDL